MTPTARILGPLGGRLVLAGLLAILAALAGVTMFVAVGEIVRVLVSRGPAAGASTVRTLAVVALVAVPARFLLATAASAVSHVTDARMQLDLRRRLAGRLGELPLGWFDDRHSGRVASVLTEDVEALHFLVAHALLDLVTTATASLATLAYLAVLDPRLAGFALVPVLAHLIVHRAQVRVARRTMGGLGPAGGRLAAAVVELVDGAAVVKAFGRSQRAHRRFGDAADDWATTFEAAVAPLLRLDAVGTLVVSPVVLLLVVGLPGLALISAGSLAVPDLVAAVVVGLAICAPLARLSFFAQNLRAAATAAAAVCELLDTEPLPEAARPGRPAGHDVALTDVAFAYTPGTPVLEGVTARFEPGTVTAVVGASGSGKSTLAALVARFHDVAAGSITIGGRDVRDIPTAELHHHVGVVLQDPWLLPVSIADNIRLARPDAGLDEVRRAASRARIDERIVALPRGYASVPGVDAHLSGGEAQRVAVARTLLADTPVLVLDEATAHADPDTEAEVQAALGELVADRTVLVIAHRLATVADAHRILVLDAGRLVEQGTHDELLATDGHYAAMWRIDRADRAAEAPS